MNRRDLIKRVFGTMAGAAVAAMVSERITAAPQTVPGTLVQGPDPSTYVYVEWGPDGRIAVIPHGTDSPWPDQMVRGMGIPRAEFPEFDAAHGVVFLDTPLVIPAGSMETMAIRTAYTVAVTRRPTTLVLRDTSGAAAFCEQWVNEAIQRLPSHHHNAGSVPFWSEPLLPHTAITGHTFIGEPL